MEDHQEHAKEQAIKNMKAGVITGMVVFGIGLGRYLISKFGNVNLTGYEDIGVDWYLIDLGILFLMIWGLIVQQFPVLLVQINNPQQQLLHFQPLQ